MYFLASFDLMPISASCSAGVCNRVTTVRPQHRGPLGVFSVKWLAATTYFEPPEGVAGVRASVEKAAGFGSCTQQVLCRKALGLRNVPNLRESENSRELLKCKFLGHALWIDTVEDTWGVRCVHLLWMLESYRVQTLWWVIMLFKLAYVLWICISFNIQWTVSGLGLSQEKKVVINVGSWEFSLLDSQFLLMGVYPRWSRLVLFQWLSSFSPIAFMKVQNSTRYSTNLLLVTYEAARNQERLLLQIITAYYYLDSSSSEDCLQGFIWSFEKFVRLVWPNILNDFTSFQSTDIKGKEKQTPTYEAWTPIFATGTVRKQVVSH